VKAAIVALAALCFPAVASADVAFRFPGSDAHRGYFYITAYRDHTGSGGGLEDWNCGSKTYDGHRGTDMGVGGFAGMDAGRDVVAAADGTVTYVNDGVFDRCTTGTCDGGGGFGNYVRIQHADGKVTYYGHMKKFSILVAVGDTVTCGQKLGQVGSSGHSTGPHLHFEPRVSEVSDDPFSGPCGGPTTWWVDQGAYLGLPEPLCQDTGPHHPLLSMDSGLDAIDGQVPDSHPDGDSAGIFDLEADQTVTARFYVSDDAEAFKSPNVVLGVEAPGSLLTILDWEVLDDFAGHDCGEEWCPNDANDNPANPPHASPGESFDLHLNAMSPGETKMVALTLQYLAPTDGQPPHAPVHVWVKQVEGSYAKTTFDAAPENVDEFQTFNGGDLKQELLLDTWSAPDPDDPAPDPDDPSPDPDDPGDPSDPGDDGGITGGCAVSSAPGAGGTVPLLALVALALRRRRRAR